VFTSHILASDQVVKAVLLDTQTNQLTATIYAFGFNYPTLLPALDFLIPSSASFSRDGTS